MARSRRKTKTKTKRTKADPRDVIRDQIVEALENLPEGAVWALPWRKLGSPVNALTGKAYSGMNVLILTVRAMGLGVEAGAWLTFKQARELGGCVRKGEKGVRCVFYRLGKKTDEETGEESSFPILKTFTLFHTSQADGLDPERTILPDPAVAPSDEDFSPGAELTELLEVCPVPLEVGGEVASYSPVLDRIRMPSERRFFHRSDWWRTYLHELAHATGHPSRLARARSARFGSRDYAFEELVAELAAAVMSQRFGVSGAPGGQGGGLAARHAADHASYIASWIRVLTDDAKALFDAWALALEAVDWVEALPGEPAHALGAA